MIANVIKNNTIQDHIQITDDECRSYTVDSINKDTLINDLCAEFKADNSLFNRDRFADACE